MSEDQPYQSDDMETTTSPPTVTRADLPAQRAAAIPERIGPFKVLSKIGEGGMGTVYEAEQESPKRRVALKVIRAGLASAAVLKRFALESQVLGRLQHPGIAQVYQAGTAATEMGSLPYFAMEFVHGVDVRKFVSLGNLSTRQRLELLTRICDAVHHAHQKGVIHRDLKPGNILVDQSGQPKILDFGVARATDADLQVTTMQTDVGQIIGTLQYMSPEQVAADPNDLDTRSDVYALGVIAYEILTGQMPYDLKNKMIHEAARIIRDEGLTRLSMFDRALRGDIETIVAKAMAKEKERRYQSAAGLGEDIQRYLDDEPILARPPSAAYQLQKFARRNKALAGGLAIAMVALIIGFVTSTYLYFQAETARKGEAAQRTVAEDQRRRADEQRDRAVQAEAETQTRADQLETVSDFQADMLAQIDPTQAGVELTADVLGKFTGALEKANVPEGDRARQVESFKRQWTRVNATDVARELIDRTILKPAIRTIDERFKDQPLVDAQLRQTLANRYRDLGLYDAALPLQTSALNTRRRVLGDDHLETLGSVNDMGHQLEVQGKLDEAMPFYRESLDTCRRILGKDDPQTLAAINNIGLLLLRQGKLDEAEPYFREGLAVSRRVRGDEHPGTLTYISNMGQLLVDQGKLDEAEPYYREALEGNRRVWGDDHPSTLLSINNMGLLLQRQGKPDEAEAYYREALEGYRRVLGDDHPTTLNSINNMGMLLRELGDLDGAELNLRQAVEGRRRVLGDRHPNTLTSISNLAFFFEQTGRFAEAEPYCREALRGKRRVLGDDHRDTLISISNMAKLLVEVGKGEEAERLAREAVDRGKATLGETHWFVGNFLGKHGLALALLGRHAEAEEALLEGHGILVAALGDNHEQTRRVIGYLAELYDAWHAAESGKGYDAKAAEWRAKLATEESKENE